MKIRPAASEHGTLVASASASFIAKAHTLLSICAFSTALLFGVGLHFQKIVRNQHYSYPDEWFPSVSATIGDWAPERQVFQVLIALTSGPRLLLVLASYFLSSRVESSGAGALVIVGFLRTLLCGGWVYVPSWEGGEFHDICMIGYIVSNIPWMLGTRALLSPPSTSAPSSRKLRGWISFAFFATLIPLVYFYVQHKVYTVAGAYSIYALFEWTLIILDIAFDSISVLDLSQLEIRIIDVGSDASSASYYYASSTTSSSSSGRYPLFYSHLAATISSTVAATGSWRHFLADSYLAFVFWSNLTAFVLGPMIFYNSVWAMGLSGDEILLFCTLSPVLLLLPPMKRFVDAHPALVALVELGGVAAYKLDDRGEQRLRTLGFSLAVGVLGWCARWHQAASSTAGRRAVDRLTQTFSVGLLLSVIAKHSAYSINPAWPFVSDEDGGHLSNRGLKGLALKIGALAVFDIAFRRESVAAVVPPSPSAPTSAPLPSLLSAYGSGALLFLIHFLFTDAGTIISWAHTGFPLGPTAIPHGFVPIFALALGTFLATHPSTSHLTTTRPSVILALASSLLLYCTKGWTAFLAGCSLGTFALAALPAFVDATARIGPSGFLRALTTYNILVLASVWTVAYEFVPGGNYLRERTDIVLGVTMALIAAGAFALPSESTLSPTWDRASRKFVAKVRLALVALVFASVAVAFRRMDLPRPYHEEARLFTAAIWTMHFGLDGRMWESQRRMADIIRDAEVDIIGLLESDLQRIVMGNRDITQYISSTLNMYADIGPSPSSHTWGCALLSKFPILNSTHLLLPSPEGELAPAIHATLDIYGELVDVVVSHNGQEEHPRDRELQSAELARVMREAWPRPVVFLGYVVTKPLEERPAPYQLLVEDGRMLDVDPTDDDRWCQYILFRGVHRVAYARLNRGSSSSSNPAITDTELQLAKFVVPERSSESEDTPSINRFFIKPLTQRRAPTVIDLTAAHRVPESLVPAAHRFPDMFYGDGVRGHRYQVLTDEQGRFSPAYYMERNEAEAESVPPECKTQ